MHIVVVDTETNGLDVRRHVAVEVAWWDLATGERGEFVPRHNVSDVLANGDIEALRINRYIDRLATAEQDWGGIGAFRLAEVLHGQRLAGCNPAFDAEFLTKMFDEYEDRELVGPPAWHHRKFDLSSYAAGVLGLDPVDLPGQATVCELLGIENHAPHTAAGDRDAAGRCFLELMKRRQG